MLVEMVKMRHAGRKFTPEQLRAQSPVRGELSIYVRRETLIAAVLPEHRLPDDIPSLEAPRLTRMQGDSFVLVGFELADLHRGGQTRYQQAWWCRLPAGQMTADFAVPQAPGVGAGADEPDSFRDVCELDERLSAHIAPTTRKEAP